nr:hypothetical protein [Mycobacterium tuberculosis]
MGHRKLGRRKLRHRERGQHQHGLVQLRRPQHG